MLLTPNFSAAEFDVGEPWPAALEANRLRLAERLQWLRNLAGVPGIISSAFRSPAHNAAVDGVESSQHVKGEAVDVVFYLVPLRTLGERILAAVRAGSAPAFGQIILYVDRGHVHLSLPTLGSRNGELRFSRVVAGHREYPFLTSAEQLPMVSEAQARRGLQLLAVVAGAVVILTLLVRARRRVAP